MATERIDSVIDLQKVQAEIDTTSKGIADLVAQINAVKNTSLNITGAKSHAEVEKLNKELQKNIKLTNDAAAAVINEERVRQQSAKTIQAESRAAEAAAKVKLAESRAAEAAAKAKLAEIKLREANKAVAEKEAEALKKAEAAKQTESQNNQNFLATHEQVVAAKKAQEQAAIDYAKSLEFQKEKQEELDAAIRSAAESGNQRAQLVRAEDITPSVKAVQSYRDELEQLTGTLNENEALQIQYKNDIAAISSELKMLDKSTNAAQKNTVAYKNRVQELTGQQNRLKIESRDLQKTINNQIKLENSAAGSADNLRARYNLLIQTFERLNVTEQQGALGQRLTTEAAAIDVQLKKLEGTTGRFQRNVGNYTNGIVNVFKKGYAGLRTIANLLPALGISTLLLIIFNGLKKVTEAFGLFNNKLSETERAQKTIAGVYKEATKSIGEQAATLSIYRNRLNDLSIPESKRLKTLASYNETADETNKIDAKQINNLDLINSKIEKQNELILKRAISLAATAKLGELATSFVDAQLELELVAAKAGKTVEQFEKEIKLYNERNLAMGADFKMSVRQRDEKTKLQNTTAKSLNLSRQELGLATNLIEKRDKERKQLEEAERALSDLILLEPVKQGGKDPYSDMLKKRIEANRKALFEIQAAGLKDRQDFYQRIANDERKSLYERLFAERQVFEAKKDLINLKTDFEINTEGKTKEEIKSLIIQGGYEILQIERDFAERRLKIKESVSKKLADEEKSLQDKLAKLIEEGYKKFEKSEEDRLKKDKERQDKELKNLEDFNKAKSELQKNLITELQSVLFTGLTRGLDLEKNAIQQQIDLLERKKQKDIEVANQTITNTQERAAAIAVIEARANAQREQLQQKQRQLDIKKAQFDKAQAMARIVQETAVGIIKLLADPNPLSKGLIPLLIAASAAQLAAVALQPVPRYAQGTSDHPGGPAIVGDGGRSEGITLPDGTVIKSPATSTLMNLPAGTKVHPDYDKMLLQSTMTRPPDFKKSSVSDTSTPKILNGLALVEKAIKKLPQPIIKTENILSRKIRKGGSSTEFI